MVIKRTKGKEGKEGKGGKGKKRKKRKRRRRRREKEKGTKKKSGRCRRLEDITSFLLTLGKQQKRFFLYFLFVFVPLL